MALHPAMLLRQLASVGGRGLLLGVPSKAAAAAAHYVTLAARCPGAEGAAGDWRLVYRSEAAGGTCNPEWRPLVWSDLQLLLQDALLDSPDVQLLLALHAVDPAAASQGDLQRPLLFEAARRPALRLPEEPPPLPLQPQQQQQQPQPTEQAPAAATDGGAAEEAGSNHVQPGQEHNGPVNGSAGDAGKEQPADGQPQDAAAGQQQDAAAAPAADAQPAPADCTDAAAAALAGTGCCPGALVAAWRLASLESLFPAGADLAELQQPLQPNTLVLHFPGGSYLCPPPLRQQERGPGTAPSSLHASPLKRAPGQVPVAPAAGEERGEGAAAAPGAGRRFASLLVSKLVGRSTPNLQDAAGSLGTSSAAAAAGAADAASEHSDAESDAGSEWTAITSTSRLTTATEAPAAAAAAAAAAGGPASRAAGGAGSSGGGGGAKAITLASACQCVASLAALQARLRDLAGRSQALQQQLAAGLEPRQRRRQQDAALAALGAEAEGCRRRADEAQRELAELRAAAAGNRKLATVRAQALVTSLKVMQGADRRVGEAEASLAGEEGRGALVAVLRELVARRCQMVCQLGALFQLGPTAVSIPEAPPGGYLEERLERQWAGAAAGNGGEGAYGASSAGGLGSRLGSGLSSGLGGGYAGVDTPSKYRQEMLLTIGGLEVRPGVWRKAFEEGGYESDAGEDRAAGVALGYVAQVVDRLGAYLGVPLRYPLALRGSRSCVIDSHPPLAPHWSEAGGGSGGGAAGGGGGAQQAQQAAQQRPVEYPLYCDSNRERPRFAVGVFLLNKDVIQLLQAHGISAGGPNHLLHNLHKLLLAAQSALPHLPP